MEDCIQSDCAVWKYSQWSDCSQNCDKGIKTRTVYCSTEDSNIILGLKYANSSSQNLKFKYLMNSLNNRNKTIEISEDKCTHLVKPNNVTDCGDLIKCPEWKIGAWTSCSVTCGQGIKMRSVQCSSTKTIDCSSLSRPKNSEICKMPPCAAQWQVGNWSEV